jgi:hypothetical protein
VIWKYEILIGDDFAIEMPKGAQILKVALQYGKPVMWALIDKDAKETEIRHFFLLGTGHLINNIVSNSVNYIDTFLMEQDRLVLHLFETAHRRISI